MLFLLKQDFEFEEFYREASEYLEDTLELRRMKAECDARFYYKVDEEICSRFEEKEKQYYVLVRDFSRAAFFGKQGLVEREKELYHRVLHEVEQMENPQDNMPILDLVIDAAFFLKDLEKFRKYTAHKNSLEKDSLYQAFERELENRTEEAEVLFCEYFKRHPDVSTFHILNGFYCRHGMKEKSVQLFEDALADMDKLVYHADSFYEGYIFNVMNQWKDINGALGLYVRFYDKFEDMAILREVEEVLKPQAADYGALEERICWNEYILTHAPIEVQPHIYRDMFFLYLTNYKLWEAEHVLDIMQKKHLPIEKECRNFVNILRRPQKQGCYTKYPTGLMQAVERNRQRMGLYPEYYSFSYTLMGSMILIPVQILVLLFMHGRERELENFQKIYLTYSGIISLQKSLYAREDALFRNINRWVRTSEKVILCAPTLVECAKERQTHDRHSPERIQMDVFAREHPEVVELFAEFA